MSAFIKGPVTGRHVTAIFVGFFAVVVGVNLLMARFASSTFGGVVVDNSYVASQHFNRWLDAAEQQQALGWKAETSRRADNRVVIALIGAPAAGVAVAAVARHPVGRAPDQTLSFARAADGSFVSTTTLAPGRWRLRIQAAAGQQGWRSEQDIL